MPDEVKIVEVGPGDGLQNIAAFVPTETKLELIKQLAGTGLQHIECASFVSPKWVPQMADASEVLGALEVCGEAGAAVRDLTAEGASAIIATHDEDLAAPVTKWRIAIAFAKILKVMFLLAGRGTRMPKKRAGLIRIACLFFAFFAPVSAAEVGFRAVAGDAVYFGIWYPTKAQAQAGRLGPFDVFYARDAAPESGFFPLVVISHGFGGRYRNHHLIASFLAENGFVVVAPQHARPTTTGLLSIPARIGDIRAALTAVESSPDLAPIIDRENINAVGYSLGTATMLAAAGAKIDVHGADQHCEQNAAQDADFCGGGLSILQIARFVFKLAWEKVRGFFDDDPPADAVAAGAPISFRKIALIAPIGEGLDAASLADFSAEVLIARLTADDILRSPFHAERLRTLLPSARARYLKFDAHHFAFIAPFPKWLTEQEHIPVAIDPPGFDRATFIEKTNQAILDFLRD